MKIITFYLPQYHEIPENNKWWGKGFTEWTTLKKASPLFPGHIQPRTPLQSNYYNLLEKDTMVWQAKLAKENGIYGWCIYHYWFTGHLLLEKPTELLLKNTDIDIPFCICWANESWTNGWVSKKEEFLIKQENGDIDDWKKHFDYLLPFFKDSRYIRKDDMPIFVIYRPELFPRVGQMITFWNQLAIENGLKGICFLYQTIQKKLKTEDYFSYRIEYQPNYAIYDLNHNKHKFLKWIKRMLTPLFRVLNINIESAHAPGLVKMNYDDIWEAILSRKATDTKSIPGAFINWDNTPRKQERGSLMIGYDVKKFQSYLEKQIENSTKNYHSDMIFLFAWNEWTEGGFLEPDELEKNNRLLAVKKALEKH